MSDEILIVDDRLNEVQPLIDELHVRGLADRVVYKETIREARTWLEGNVGLPLAVVSDLSIPGESPNNGAHFLERTHKKAIEAGSGVWTFLLSGLDDHVYDIAESLSIPNVRAFRKRDPASAATCARMLKALYQEELPSDLQDLQFAFEGRSAPARRVPAKDRIFVLSSGTAEFQPLVDDCPLAVQTYDGEAPVFYYRGVRTVVETNSKEWLVQVLLRWRIMATTMSGPMCVGDLAGGTRRKDGSTDRDAIETYERDILKIETLNVPYGPKIPSVHNIVGDANRHSGLKHLAEYLFPKSPCLFPNVKPAWNSGRKDMPERELPLPPDLANSDVDGFFKRAHFILDEENVKVLHRWRRWIDWKSTQ